MYLTSKTTTKTNKTSVMRFCPSHTLFFIVVSWVLQTKECGDAASKYDFFDLVQTTIRWYIRTQWPSRKKLVYSYFAKSVITMEQSPAMTTCFYAFAVSFIVLKITFCAKRKVIVWTKQQNDVVLNGTDFVLIDWLVIYLRDSAQSVVVEDNVCRRYFTINSLVGCGKLF